MKVILEGREFELKANGYFMKKYHQEFKSNMMTDLALAAQKADSMKLAQLTYCAIQDCDMSFDEWLNSFETPCFIRPEVANKVLTYLARDTEPTVAPVESGSKSSKKKKN